ncbi:ATP-binding protein [Streptomyces virginiae]|uniref:ATP-binding protein n=1 Tax=Streptomyces virginiae TaxID=1961 RepID=UPI0035DCEEE9
MAAHHQLAFTIDPTASAAHQARHRVVAGIRSWGIRLDEEALNGIELVASELITNAVLHAASGPVAVSVLREGAVLVVEVHDTAKALPFPKPGGDGESGRGLHLMSVLADRHGTAPTATGKRCWAEFDLPSDSGDRRTERDGGRDDRRLSTARAGEAVGRAARKPPSPARHTTSHMRTKVKGRAVAVGWQSRPPASQRND